jgi:hypothetical protein
MHVLSKLNIIVFASIFFDFLTFRMFEEIQNDLVFLNTSMNSSNLAPMETIQLYGSQSQNEGLSRKTNDNIIKPKRSKKTVNNKFIKNSKKRNKSKHSRSKTLFEKVNLLSLDFSKFLSSIFIFKIVLF